MSTHSKATLATVVGVVLVASAAVYIAGESSDPRLALWWLISTALIAVIATFVPLDLGKRLLLVAAMSSATFGLIGAASTGSYGVPLIIATGSFLAARTFNRV